MGGILKNIKFPSDFSGHEHAAWKDFNAIWQTCPLQSEPRITIHLYQLLTIYIDARKRKRNEESHPMIYFIWIYFIYYIYYIIIIIITFFCY